MEKVIVSEEQSKALDDLIKINVENEEDRFYLIEEFLGTLSNGPSYRGYKMECYVCLNDLSDDEFRRAVLAGYTTAHRINKELLKEKAGYFYKGKDFNFYLYIGETTVNPYFIHADGYEEEEATEPFEVPADISIQEFITRCEQWEAEI